MGKLHIHFDEKYLEQKISLIGARVAEATALAEKSQELCKKSSKVLANAQNELSELYVFLDEILPGLRQPVEKSGDELLERVEQQV